MINFLFASLMIVFTADVPDLKDMKVSMYFISDIPDSPFANRNATWNYTKNFDSRITLVITGSNGKPIELGYFYFASGYKPRLNEKGIFADLVVLEKDKNLTSRAYFGPDLCTDCYDPSLTLEVNLWRMYIIATSHTGCLNSDGVQKETKGYGDVTIDVKSNRNADYIVTYDYGSWENTYQYQTSSQVKWVKYFGMNGEPVLNNKGYHCEKYAYTRAEGNISEYPALSAVSYFGIKGEKVLNNKGYHQKKWDKKEYKDKEYYEEIESYYGTKGEKIANTNGIHRIVTKTFYKGSFSYADSTTISYYGTKEEPVLNVDGVSEIKKVYSDDKYVGTNEGNHDVGNEKYYGLCGEPVLCKNGYHGILFDRPIWSYGRSRKRNIGLNNEPLADKNGIYCKEYTESSFERAWIGVTIQQMTPDLAKQINTKPVNGILVIDVIANSPAQKAGVKKGDIITAIDGQTISETTELSNKINGTAAGKAVSLSLLRNNSRQDISVVVAIKPLDYVKVSSIKYYNVEGKPVNDEKGIHHYYALNEKTQETKSLWGADGKPVADGKGVHLYVLSKTSDASQSADGIKCYGIDGKEIVLR